MWNWVKVNLLPILEHLFGLLKDGYLVVVELIEKHPHITAAVLFVLIVMAVL